MDPQDLLDPRVRQDREETPAIQVHLDPQEHVDHQDPPGYQVLRERVEEMASQVLLEFPVLGAPVDPQVYLVSQDRKVTEGSMDFQESVEVMGKQGSRVILDPQGHLVPMDLKELGALLATEEKMV